ncbi:MAG: disulfide oxidoreductase [Candidatus Aquicultor secundus]|uniref:DUF1858 domain-containing protein n=1 Tax=Candidatus Aquicultor secundus TaxID=1973895 RepID=UPI00090F72E8|nr:DUF1858 domain-containing protein [Candidatus Aquicultor secundus]OIO87867.1 MAG: disulfide oxidoreductase [Candidatus Aquicultor secundus]PIU26512.1 MAG: disulfide oxidoreductase [Candidatus Aquicultor secundus]PIW21389.1 MAG: disulfide oxidoreductase [Candidatus Aquicultor secundus]PIY38793.1 MAG: disulfide oxidoreductase [Candidatus Aquicultor secundus]PJB77992.1 MAG: disulfide oxidoreductase [Candidatus Aquicultor secundus]
MAITKETTISDCVEQYPETVEVLCRYGLACFGCAVSRLENIQQGAALHGIDADTLVAELNAAIIENDEPAIR